MTSIIIKLYSLIISIRFGFPKTRFRPYINKIIGSRYFDLGKRVSFGKNVVLSAWSSYREQSFSPSVIIGNNCCFGDYLHLTCINNINIGDNILTGRWVTITDNSHGLTDNLSLAIPPLDRPLVSKGPVTIGKNVWIGDKVTILPGVTIGDCCIIGANSVVVKDIPDFSIACGNPAKVIKSFKHE